MALHRFIPMPHCLSERRPQGRFDLLLEAGQDNTGFRAILVGAEQWCGSKTNGPRIKTSPEIKERCKFLRLV